VASHFRLRPDTRLSGVIGAVPDKRSPLPDKRRM